ncbi:MAG: Rieske (2Fe-2S) protein [Cyclobacteriaceae bacterium]
MERRIFIKKCSKGCLGVMATGLLLEGCAGPRYISGILDNSFLKIPKDAFLKEDNSFLKYVVVQNDSLQYPIAVFRVGPDEYKALLMKCTHQGTELQVFGDRLQCPAHGSEFTRSGSVQNGPADSALRSFKVEEDISTLKINLS